VTEPKRTLRRPGRTPGSINLAVALAALGVLLPLLLSAATGAPPSAAEFAPNARQVIKKAPPGQAADVNGTGEGDAKAAGGGKASPAAAASPSAAASAPPPAQTLQVAANQVKACVGPPPLRQIEDPQSPPCIAYWKGDNGGATSRGVTRDSIYIAVPTPENAKPQYDALFAFFNKRFQFYGRKLVPEYCSESNSGAADQPTQVADAATSASGCGGTLPKPFASTFYRQNNGAFYMPEMACRYKTIVVGSYSPYDSKFMNRCAPYQYQYPMEVDEEFANIGEWACARLAGKVAKWAGGSDSSAPPKALNTLPRKFGILLEPFTDTDPVARRSALTPMVSRLHTCGVDIPDKDAIINPVTGSFDPSTAQNAILQLKNDNVTSVICMCNFFSFGTLQRAAESSAYQPEWITSTFGLNDVNSSFVLGAGPPGQMQHTFGVTFQPRMVNPLTNPYNVALQEGDPSQSPDTATTGEAKLEVYRALLLLASGIQMAGPNLTVETFRDGLRNARFPNPVIPALNAGAVDVRPGGYSLTADGAEWWYSTTARGPFSDSAGHPGTGCYIDGGRRHTLGSWPRGDAPFFSGTCDSGA
jgi:hypothetical protein